MSIKHLSFIDHLKKLRIRLIISGLIILFSFIICYLFYEDFIDLFLQPFNQALSTKQGKIFYVHSILEAFVTKVEISFLLAMILSIPLHLINLLGFLMPALYKKEKIVIILTVLVSLALIVAAFIYAYKIILPVSFQFLMNEQFYPEKLGILLHFKSNIFIIFQLLFICILVFQIPLILELILALKIISLRILIMLGRYIILAIFIFAALITPPDFISQLLIALPLTFLFFIAILIAKIFGLGR